MNKTFSIFCLYLTTLTVTCLGQSEYNVYDYWKYYEGEPSKMLYKQLTERAFSQLKDRNLLINRLKTPAQWRQRQVDLKEKLANSIGMFPEKTPLNPVVTGIIKKKDFRVEKLYFESRPGYFVTAALFLPETRTKPAPAIVYCSGHTTEGFRSETYQKIILNYVKKGFIVLAFDPIGQGERSQYPGTELQKSAVKEHSYPGAQSFLSGRPLANYFIWDGIRTVDYLLTRKEVDPTRLGIAGRSGGGTQSAYIAAMDERIIAAAPECYITSFDRLLRSNGPQDAEQNLLHGLTNGLDMADFLTVRAPKPALIVATTNDMFAIQGARDAYHEAQDAYKVFGSVQDIQMTEDDAGHASTPKNREASYAFFQKALNNPGDSTDQAVDFLSPSELQVTTTGQVVTDLQSETIFTLNKKYGQQVIEARKKTFKAEDLSKAIANLTGYRTNTMMPEIIFSGRMLRDGFSIERYLVKGSGNHFLPVLWLVPASTTQHPVMMLEERGKAAAAAEGALAESLAKAGHPVLLPDLSGVGELGTGYIRGGDSVIENIPLNLWHLGILTQQYPLAIRMEEIGLLTRFIKHKIPTQTELIGISNGTLGSELLHAANVKNGFTKLILIAPLISFESVVKEQYYQTKYIPSAAAGILAHYDLPDLLSAIPQLHPVVINPCSANGKEWILKAHHMDGQTDIPPFVTIKNGLEREAYTEWLRDHLSTPKKK